MKRKEEMPKNFAPNLRYLIKESDFTVRETAQMIGIHVGMLNNIMFGIQTPRPGDIQALASHFEITEEELLYKDLTDGAEVVGQEPHCIECGNNSNPATGTEAAAPKPQRMECNGKKDVNIEFLLLSLNDIRAATMTMKHGLEAIKDRTGVSCMAVIENSLKGVCKALKEFGHTK